MLFNANPTPTALSGASPKSDIVFSIFFPLEVLLGRLGRLGHIGIFDGSMFTCPRTFLAAGAGVRVTDVYMRAPGPVHFYKNSLRADLHTFPAALARMRREADVLGFTQKKKLEHIHNLF